ncbi:acyl-CoA carboxylase subunit epsilon [Streptomyces sp. NPDC049577]|uniref:acyl-CoA carboxylase subunit epsilon n=1 Tax=Streptomyces sp. NPDC049577 TaxID=3155153 RepID=UPI0034264B86
MIRIVKGEPDEAELAAVTLVLLAAARRTPDAAPDATAGETPWVRDVRHRRSLLPHAFEGDGRL